MLNFLNRLNRSIKPTILFLISLAAFTVKQALSFFTKTLDLLALACHCAT